MSRPFVLEIFVASLRCANLILNSFWNEGVDKALESLGIRMSEHAVVIDAGSTGSRVLAFSFHRGALDRQLHLTDELWQEVKPGENFIFTNKNHVFLCFRFII